MFAFRVRTSRRCRGGGARSGGGAPEEELVVIAIGDGDFDRQRLRIEDCAGAAAATFEIPSFVSARRIACGHVRKLIVIPAVSSVLLAVAFRRRVWASLPACRIPAAI